MNFVSEKEISNAKGDAEAEPNDNRTLYERLKEVRDKKQLEIDEAHKFKNQFRGIDEEEADFLRMVDNSKNEAEIKRKREEMGLIEQIASQTVTTSEMIQIKPTLKIISPAGFKSVSKQASLVSMGVRKRLRNEDAKSETPSPPSISPRATAHSPKRLREAEGSALSTDVIQPDVHGESNIHSNYKAYVAPSLCQVIGVLPALVAYNDSSDDDDSNSSNSDDGCAQSLSYLAKSVPTQHNAQNGGSEATGGCHT